MLVIQFLMLQVYLIGFVVYRLLTVDMTFSELYVVYSVYGFWGLFKTIFSSNYIVLQILKSDIYSSCAMKAGYHGDGGLDLLGVHYVAAANELSYQMMPFVLKIFCRMSRTSWFMCPRSSFSQKDCVNSKSYAGLVDANFNGYTKLSIVTGDYDCNVNGSLFQAVPYSNGGSSIAFVITVVSDFSFWHGYRVVHSSCPMKSRGNRSHGSSDWKRVLLYLGN